MLGFTVNKAKIIKTMTYLWQLRENGEIKLKETFEILTLSFHVHLVDDACIVMLR